MGFGRGALRAAGFLLLSARILIAASNDNGEQRGGAILLADERLGGAA
jgi:hypothetical protein